VRILNIRVHSQDAHELLKFIVRMIMRKRMTCGILGLFATLPEQLYPEQMVLQWQRLQKNSTWNLRHLDRPRCTPPPDRSQDRHPQDHASRTNHDTRYTHRLSITQSRNCSTNSMRSRKRDYSSNRAPVLAPLFRRNRLIE